MAQGERTPEVQSGDDAEAELRSLRERVRELERTAAAVDNATELLSLVSHELRSPVHTLALGAEVALERLRRSSDHVPREWLVERMETQRRTTRRLKALIDMFLEVAQLSTGKLTLDLQSVDLRDVALDVARAATDELTWTSSACTVDGPAPVVGRWDRLQLELVLTNLLSNAMKYGAGHPIDVSVRCVGDHGVVSVRDRGIGIAPEQQARIFEKYVRVPGASRVGGVGLGLWIVRQIVTALGGQVGVVSTVGGGATFTVTLPLAGPSS